MLNMILHFNILIRLIFQNSSVICLYIKRILLKKIKKIPKDTGSNQTFAKNKKIKKKKKFFQSK